MDFKEAQTSGVLTVYTDTDPELEREVREYNELMTECRKKKRRISELEGAFFFLNLFVVVFSDPFITLLIDLHTFVLLLIFTATFIYFTMIKKNLIIPTAVLALLILLYSNVTTNAFAVIAAADIILAVWHTKAMSKLKKFEGYPHFTDIMIRYSRLPENGIQI